jgi:hypothetical protein
MSTFQELDSILTSVKWHSDLAPIIQEYLNTFPRNSLTIDNLLSASTKLVENNLREEVQDFTKATVPSEHGFGVDLLNYCKTKGFVPETKRGSECIFTLIYSYFEEFRNRTHHSFVHFPLPMVLLIICSTNYLLDKIDNLKTNHVFYAAKASIENDEKSHSIVATVKDIEKDRKPIDPTSLEMVIVNPDKSMKSYPLTNQGDCWETTATYGDMQGTLRIDFIGFTKNREKFQITGSCIVTV